MGQIEQGFNSDIIHSGKKFHIQTEDWGDKNPFVVTKVFQGGAVLVSIKTPYESLVQLTHAAGRQAIKLGMRDQHQRVLDQLVSGTLLNSQHKIKE